MLSLKIRTLNIDLTWGDTFDLHQVKEKKGNKTST